MTTRTEVAQKVTELVGTGAWQAVPVHPGLLTIRWSQDDLPTPDYVREGRGAPYPFETYHRMVFLTFIGAKTVMRACAAPWVRCQDTTPPLWLVLEILQDPELAMDTNRQLVLKRDRKAAAMRRSRAKGAGR